MIKLHCHSVFCMSFWYLKVGSLERKRKLFAARNVFTFFEHSSEFKLYCLALISLSKYCISCYKFLIELFCNI